MFRNYINIAIRNFIKDRFYSLINLAGLALGIATSLLIVMYIYHELSYDNFHPNVENKYRVNQTDIWSPDGGRMSSTVLPLAQALLSDYPEVKSALRVNTMGTHTFRTIDQGITDKIFNEPDIVAADSNFFQFFGFPLIKGNPEEALRGVNKVVLSVDAAEKYFGKADPIGKTLYMDKERVPLEVTGIAETPSNAHFKFDFLLSIYTNPFVRDYEWNWIATQVVTYVELEPEVDVAQLENKFLDIADNHIKVVMRRFNVDYDEFMEGKGEWSFYLQPVLDVNLYSEHLGNRLGEIGNISYLYIFGAVALFILILASINFMNLSTARASLRAKEVGVRKVVGSSRKQLVIQLLIESFILCVLATLLGLGVMELIRIVITYQLDLSFGFTLWQQPQLLVMVLLIPLVLGLLAGIYPAFYLTSFSPAQVLKGKVSQGARHSGFRNTLVVIQFTISIALAICTIVVFQQINFFSQKNLGFNKNNILVINNAQKLGDQLESFRNEIAKQNGVENASIAMEMFGRGSYEDIFTKESDNTRLAIAQLKIDDHFFQTMELELLTGRPFSEDRPSDKNAVIINETTMKLYGWDQQTALGQHIIYMGDDVGKLEVIGVVKDFNHQSLRQSINPFMFFHINSNMWGDSRVVAIKTNGENARTVLDQTRKKWEQYAGDNPFEYSFLDDEFDNLYASEERLGTLFSIFAGFALFIACIGLFGLAAFTIHQRNKEIGIRKVLGASVTNLVLMLNGNFSRLILFSCLLALPLAWYAMTRWLEQFEYKVNIRWEVFVLTAVFALFIAWLTVSYQSIKAAISNPVETLKNE